MPNSLELVGRLAKAYALTEIVHLGHERVQEQLNEVSLGLVSHRLVLECRKGSLWADGTRVEESPEVADLAAGMSQCGVDFMSLGPNLPGRLVGELLDSLRIASISGRVRRLKEFAGFHGDELQVVFGVPAGQPPTLGRSAEAIFAGALANESKVSDREATAPPGSGRDWDPPGYGSGGGPEEAPSAPVAEDEGADDAPSGAVGVDSRGSAAEAGQGTEPEGTDPRGEPADDARDRGEASPGSQAAEGRPPAAEETMSPGEFRRGVELFMAGPPAKRRAWVGPLAAQAARVDVDADIQTTLDILVTLLGADDGDESVVEVATKLMTPAVAQGLGARLGMAEDEEERGDYLQVAHGLASQVAPSFAEELAISEDPATRRALVHALAYLGDAAMPVVRDLLGRPEWYVVRNAVSVLSAMGGEEGLALLEPCLAHEDARVRREAVMALSRIGHSSAGPRVLPLLSDDDADVRAAAAQCLGGLVHASAAPALRDRLVREDNEVVLVEVLRALGRMGDPEAVEGIRQRAMPSFFVRPSRPVRIAGLRALGRIASPEAVALLEASAEDRDPDLRGAAQQALEDMG